MVSTRTLLYAFEAAAPDRQGRRRKRTEQRRAGSCLLSSAIAPTRARHVTEVFGVSNGEDAQKHGCCSRLVVLNHFLLSMTQTLKINPVSEHIIPQLSDKIHFHRAAEVHVRDWISRASQSTTFTKVVIKTRRTAINIYNSVS